MLAFCPWCANSLVVEGNARQVFSFVCSTCPYTHRIKKTLKYRTYSKLKEVDDITGGSAGWENVDSTDEKCPKCDHPRAYFMHIQTRSADEPMTTFYRCCNNQCQHRWRD